mmetsp:Transcript_163180/g.523355  ORF Transcript_163180/g.523355 Transcript_163180/m.523355 type:complete len:419 (-) Transcript_163180:259-1515(-)
MAKPLAAARGRQGSNHEGATNMDGAAEGGGIGAPTGGRGQERNAAEILGEVLAKVILALVASQEGDITSVGLYASPVQQLPCSPPWGTNNGELPRRAPIAGCVVVLRRPQRLHHGDALECCNTQEGIAALGTEDREGLRLTMWQNEGTEGPVERKAIMASRDWLREDLPSLTAVGREGVPNCGASQLLHAEAVVASRAEERAVGGICGHGPQVGYVRNVHEVTRARIESLDQTDAAEPVAAIPSQQHCPIVVSVKERRPGLCSFWEFITAIVLVSLQLLVRISFVIKAFEVFFANPAATELFLFLCPCLLESGFLEIPCLLQLCRRNRGDPAQKLSILHPPAGGLGQPPQPNLWGAVFAAFGLRRCWYAQVPCCCNDDVSRSGQLCACEHTWDALQYNSGLGNGLQLDSTFCLAQRLR